MSTDRKTKRLVLDERERRYFEKLPIAMRRKIAEALDQEDLAPIDRRAGENSHWHAKRAARIYMVKLPSGRTQRLTAEEACSHLSCSLEYFKDVMSRPLTKMKPRHVYSETTPMGEVVVTKAGET